MAVCTIGGIRHLRRAPVRMWFSTGIVLVHRHELVGFLSFEQVKLVCHLSISPLFISIYHSHCRFVSTHACA